MIIKSNSNRTALYTILLGTTYLEPTIVITGNIAQDRINPAKIEYLK